MQQREPLSVPPPQPDLPERTHSRVLELVGHVRVDGGDVGAESVERAPQRSRLKPADGRRHHRGRHLGEEGAAGSQRQRRQEQIAEARRRQEGARRESVVQRVLGRVRTYAVALAALGIA